MCRLLCPFSFFAPMMHTKWTLILSTIVEVLCKKFFIFEEEEEEEGEEEEEEEEEEEKFTRIYKRAMKKSFSMAQWRNKHFFIVVYHSSLVKGAMNAARLCKFCKYAYASFSSIIKGKGGPSAQ